MISQTGFKGILQRKSILFAGWLNFLNKPLFWGWPIDYWDVRDKIPFTGYVCAFNWMYNATNFPTKLSLCKGVGVPWGTPFKHWTFSPGSRICSLAAPWLKCQFSLKFYSFSPFICSDPWIFNPRFPPSSPFSPFYRGSKPYPSVNFKLKGAIIFYREGGVCFWGGGPEFFGVVKGGGTSFSTP